MEVTNSSKAQYQQFLDFCTISLRGENPKFLDLIKTRYESCDAQFRRSSKMVELLQETQQNMENEESRKFVHLKDFLTELKASSSQKKKKKKEKRQRTSSDSEVEVGPASKLPKLTECSVLLVKTEIPANYDSDSQAGMPIGQTKSHNCSISDGNIDSALRIQQQEPKQLYNSPSPLSSQGLITSCSRNTHHSPVPGCSKGSSNQCSRNSTDEEGWETESKDKNMTSNLTGSNSNAFRRKSVAIVDVDDGSEKLSIEAVVNKSREIPSDNSFENRDDNKIQALVRRTNCYSSDEESQSHFSDLEPGAYEEAQKTPPLKKSVSIVNVDESVSPDIMVIEPKKDNSFFHKENFKADKLFDNMDVKQELPSDVLVQKNPFVDLSLKVAYGSSEEHKTWDQHSSFLTSDKNRGAPSASTSEWLSVKDDLRKEKKEKEENCETATAQPCDKTEVLSEKAVTVKIKEPRRVPLVSCERLSHETSSTFVSRSHKDIQDKVVDRSDESGTDPKFAQNTLSRAETYAKTTSDPGCKRKSHEARIGVECGSSGDEFETKDKARKTENRKSSDKHVRKLENLLESLRNEIEKCQKKELTLDDMEDETSSYVYESKLKNKFVSAWSKLCEITDRTVATGRPTEKRIRYNGTRYKEVNKRLEKFLNKKKIFPDFHDIKSIVELTNKKCKLNMRSTAILDLAREAFADIGEILQTRRHQDFIATFGNRQTDSFRSERDPYLTDPELRRKLDKNRTIAKSNLEEVIAKYTKLQYEEKDDDEDDDQEEEEEEAKNKRRKSTGKKTDEDEETGLTDDDTACVSVEDVEVDMAGEREDDEEEDNMGIEFNTYEKRSSDSSCRSPSLQAKEKVFEGPSSTSLNVPANPYLHDLSEDENPGIYFVSDKEKQEAMKRAARVDDLSQNDAMPSVTKKAVLSSSDKEDEEHDDEDYPTESRNKINKLCPKISLNNSVYIKDEGASNEDEKTQTVSSKKKTQPNVKYTARKSMPPQPKSWLKHSNSPGLSDAEDSDGIYTVKVALENSEDTDDQSSDSESENGDNNDDDDEDLILITGKSGSESDGGSDSSRGPSPVSIISLDSSSEAEDDGTAEDNGGSEKKIKASMTSNTLMTMEIKKNQGLETSKSDEKMNVLDALGLVKKSSGSISTEKLSQESQVQDRIEADKAEDSSHSKEKQTDSVSIKIGTDGEREVTDTGKHISRNHVENLSISPSVAPDDCVIILDSPTKTPCKKSLVVHESNTVVVSSQDSEGAVEIEAVDPVQGEDVCELENNSKLNGAACSLLEASELKTDSKFRSVSTKTSCEKCTVGNNDNTCEALEDVHMVSQREQKEKCPNLGEETTRNERDKTETDSNSVPKDTVGNVSSLQLSLDTNSDETMDVSKETESISSTITATKLTLEESTVTTAVQTSKSSVTLQLNTKSELGCKSTGESDDDVVIIINENSSDTFITKTSSHHNRSSAIHLFKKDISKENRQMEKNVSQCSSSSSSNPKALSKSSFKTEWLRDAIAKVNEEKIKENKKNKISDVILIDENQGQDAVIQINLEKDVLEEGNQTQEAGSKTLATNPKSKTEGSETHMAHEEVPVVPKPNSADADSVLERDNSRSAETKGNPENDNRKSSDAQGVTESDDHSSPVPVPEQPSDPSFFSEFEQFLSNNSRPNNEGVCTGSGFMPNMGGIDEDATRNSALGVMDVEKSFNISETTGAMELSQHLNSEPHGDDACKSTNENEQCFMDLKNSTEANIEITCSSKTTSKTKDGLNVTENDVSENDQWREIPRDDSTSVIEPTYTLFSHSEKDTVIPESPTGSLNDTLLKEKVPPSCPDDMHSMNNDHQQPNALTPDALHEKGAFKDGQKEGMGDDKPDKPTDRANNDSSEDPEHTMRTDGDRLNSSMMADGDRFQDSPMSDSPMSVSLLTESPEALGGADFQSLITEKDPEELQDSDRRIREGNKNTACQEAEASHSNAFPRVSFEVSEKSFECEDLPDTDLGNDKDEQSPGGGFECELIDEPSINDEEEMECSNEVTEIEIGQAANEDGSSNYKNEESKPSVSETKEKRSLESEGTTLPTDLPISRSDEEFEATGQKIGHAANKNGSSNWKNEESKKAKEKRSLETEEMIELTDPQDSRCVGELESGSDGKQAECGSGGDTNERELLKDGSNVGLEVEETDVARKEEALKRGRSSFEETVLVKNLKEDSRNSIVSIAKTGSISHDRSNNRAKEPGKSDVCSIGANGSEIEPDDIFRSISEICKGMLQNADWDNTADRGNRSNEDERNKEQTSGGSSEDERNAAGDDRENASEAESKTQEVIEPEEKVSTCGEIEKESSESNELTRKGDSPEEENPESNEPTTKGASSENPHSVDEHLEDDLPVGSESVDMKIKKSEESGSQEDCGDGTAILQEGNIRSHKQGNVGQENQEGESMEAEKDSNVDGDDINIIEELSYLKVMTSKGRSKADDRKMVDRLIMDMSLKAPEENEKSLTKSSTVSNKSKVSLSKAETSGSEKQATSGDFNTGSVKLGENAASQIENDHTATASNVTQSEETTNSSNSKITSKSDDCVELICNDNASQEDANASHTAVEESNEKSSNNSLSIEGDGGDDDTSDIAITSVEKPNTKCFSPSDDIVKEIISDVLREFPPCKKTGVLQSTHTNSSKRNPAAAQLPNETNSDVLILGEASHAPSFSFTQPCPVSLHKNKHVKYVRPNPYPSSNPSNVGQMHSSAVFPPRRQQSQSASHSNSSSPHLAVHKQGVAPSSIRQASSFVQGKKVTVIPKHSTSSVNPANNPRMGIKVQMGTRMHPQHLSQMPNLKPRVPIPTINPNRSNNSVRPLRNQPVIRQTHQGPSRQQPRFPPSANSANHCVASIPVANMRANIPRNTAVRYSTRTPLNNTPPRGRQTFQFRPQNTSTPRFSSSAQITRRPKKLDGMEIVLDDSDNEDESHSPSPKSPELSMPKIVSIKSLSNLGSSGLPHRQNGGLSLKTGQNLSSQCSNTTQSTNSSRQPSKKKGDVIVLSDSD